MRTIRLKISDLFEFEGGAGPTTPPSSDTIRAIVQRQFNFLPAPVQITVDGSDTVTVGLPEAPAATQEEASRLAAKAAKRAGQGEYDKAIAIFKRAIELHPTLQTARRDLAMVYMETEDTDSAVNHLIEALRLDSQDAWSWVVLGNLYVRHKRDIATGEKFLRKALEINPHDGWALNSLAAIRAQAGQVDQALSDFDRAISANPDFPNPYFGKASVLAASQREMEAVETLEILFTRAKSQDARSGAVFDQARQLFSRLQAGAATRFESEAFKAVDTYRRELEASSGYPIRIEQTDFKEAGVARIQMAWKHGRDHHLVKTKRGFPSHLLYHLEAHELTHLRMEVAARAVGQNRFFCDQCPD